MFKENMCKQCRHVEFKGTITKWPVKKHRTTHKHVEHQDSTDIQKKTTLYCLCVSIFIYLNDFSNITFALMILRYPPHSGNLNNETGLVFSTLILIYICSFISNNATSCLVTGSVTIN